MTVRNCVYGIRSKLGVGSMQELASNEKRDLIARFEHKVSDHMPLWLRLPLPID